MESTSGELCPLCYCFQLEFLKDTEVSKKIEKYLQIKMEYSSAGVCLNCFNSLESFHIFYEKVHTAQENLHKSYDSQSREVIIELQTNLKSDKECEEISNTQKKQKVDQTILQQKEKNETEVLSELIKNKIGDINLEEKSSKKLKSSKFKEISGEIEKKMLEFYNIKCEKCKDGKFTSFKMLSKHYMTVHNTQGYIKCCKRNIRVNDKYYLRNHMFKHLQPETCRCRVCGKELSSLATLKHHMILHKPTEERPFQCKECKKRFCCKNDLKNHEKAIHLPESEREDYICDVCGKVFQKVANLRYHHSTVHLQERKYICEICAKCFTTQSGLRTHMNAAHSTLDPIQCQECKKWLKTKDTYQKHLQLHQNNTFPCSHCDKVCNSSASLRSHLVKHSEERPYSCTICKKSFKTKTHLKNHSTQHVGGNHYKCPYCSKLFVNMSNYYTHRRRMHASERSTDRQKDKPPPAETYESLMPLSQGNNAIYDQKALKSNIENYSDPPTFPNMSTVRQNIIVSPVKYLQ